MKDNIFENAYFGKPYKTRDGRKAIYRAHYCGHHLFTENSQFTCNDEGCVVNALIPIPEFDIVSEWTEETNDDELNELAYRWAYNISGTHIKWELLQDAYKAGYNKAKNDFAGI